MENAVHGGHSAALPVPGHLKLQTGNQAVTQAVTQAGTIPTVHHDMLRELQMAIEHAVQQSLQETPDESTQVQRAQAISDRVYGATSSILLKKVQETILMGTPHSGSTFQSAPPQASLLGNPHVLEEGMGYHGYAMEEGQGVENYLKSKEDPNVNHFAPEQGQTMNSDVSKADVEMADEQAFEYQGLSNEASKDIDMDNGQGSEGAPEMNNTDELEKAESGGHAGPTKEGSKPKGTHKCPECDEYFLKGGWSEHTKQYHIGEKCFWPGCGAEIHERLGLKSHLRDHYKSAAGDERAAGDESATGDGNAADSKPKDSKKVYRCHWSETCEQTFEVYERITRHIMSHQVAARREHDWDLNEKYEQNAEYYKQKAKEERKAKKAKKDNASPDREPDETEAIPGH